MNALLPLRPIRPILGSGEEGDGRIFTAFGENAAWTRRPPPVLSPPDPLPPEPGFVPLTGPAEEPPGAAAPVASPSARQAAPLEAFPPESATPPDAVALPPPESAPAPGAPALALAEQIRIESLGLGALRVTGTNQDDLLRGGPGDDRIDGMEGDDILLGSPGRDLLYGGPGRDTIRYDLLRSEVGLDVRFQRIRLADGEDQYDSIEVIDLRDGDWVLTAADPAALVHRLFLAATGHAPTAAEMVHETAALETGGTAEGLAARLAAGAGEAVQARIRAALDAPREGRLEHPVWLPDAEAMLLSRMCELGLGGHDAFLNWLDELEAGRPVVSLAAELLATPQARIHAPDADARTLAAATAEWML